MSSEGPMILRWSSQSFQKLQNLHPIRWELCDLKQGDYQWPWQEQFSKKGKDRSQMTLGSYMNWQWGNGYSSSAE